MTAKELRVYRKAENELYYIALAEVKEDIYTLEGLAEALNLEEININNYYIRFIEVDYNK